MSVTQTVDIPVSHRLVIDVPGEVPSGKAIITFTPVEDQRSDKVSEDGLYPAAHGGKPAATSGG